MSVIRDDLYDTKLREVSALAVSYGFDNIETQQFITDWCDRHVRMGVSVIAIATDNGQRWHLAISPTYVEDLKDRTAGSAAGLFVLYGILRAFGKAALIAAAGIAGLGVAIAIVRDVLLN
jgi:hypothetical protein